jgi:hypothetical protein
MKKKMITKSMIMAVYCKTLDTIPFLEVRGTTHFERMIKWFELNDYNITTNAYHRICKYMERQSEICQQIREWNKSLPIKNR